jgi:hypothetical protein
VTTFTAQARGAGARSTGEATDDSRGLVLGKPPDMAWTYILECADGSFYVGSTTDLERRVSQHDRGEERTTPNPVDVDR